MDYKLSRGHLLGPWRARNKVPRTKRASRGHLLNPGYVMGSRMYFLISDMSPIDICLW